MSDDLVSALAAAQAEFQPIVKSHKADAGKYTYTYANLADTLAAVVPALNKHGIVLLQPMLWTEGGVELQTVLLGHGGRLTSSLPLNLDNLPAQEAGKLISYMRRYLVTSFLGLAADDDDAAANTTVKYRSDGAQASYQPRERTYAAERGNDAPQPAGNLPATDKQQGAIVAKLKTCGAGKRDEQVALLKHLTGFESVKTLTKQQASDVIDTLAPYEDGKEWGMFVYSNAGAVSVVNVGEEPFEVTS